MSTSAKVLVLSGVVALISGGCGAACEAEAEKQFPAIREATRDSFRSEWVRSYDETSGCDSGDAPWVSVELARDVRSLAEVSERMKTDQWKQLSLQEAAPYQDSSEDIALRKESGGWTLIAVIRESPQGKDVEVKVES